MGVKRSEARVQWMEGNASGSEVVRGEVKRGLSDGSFGRLVIDLPQVGLILGACLPTPLYLVGLFGFNT
jgi:hypothetical protein